METLIFGNWKLTVDKEQTVKAYNAQPKGTADAGSTSQLRNFVAYRDKAYPDIIKNLLLQLGIDYKKEEDLYHIERQENGLHLYGGWFHFKGTAVRVKEGSSYEEIPGDRKFAIKFLSSGRASTFFENKDGLVQVDFHVEVPWVLKGEPEPE